MLVSMAGIGLALSVYNEEMKQRQQQETEQLSPQTRRSDLRVVGRR